jgi:hypothetical protein
MEDNTMRALFVVIVILVGTIVAQAQSIDFANGRFNVPQGIESIGSNGDQPGVRYMEEVRMLDLDGTHLLLYWFETDGVNIIFKTQTSSNGGKTWNVVTEMMKLPVVLFSALDLDSIIKLKSGRLVATFAAQTASPLPLETYLITMYNDGYGNGDWFLLSIPLYMPDSYFLGLPELSTEYNQWTESIYMYTTLAVWDPDLSKYRGFIFFVVSENGGLTWYQNQLAEIPL